MLRESFDGRIKEEITKGMLAAVLSVGNKSSNKKSIKKKIEMLHKENKTIISVIDNLLAETNSSTDDN